MTAMTFLHSSRFAWPISFCALLCLGCSHPTWAQVQTSTPLPSAWVGSVTVLAHAGEACQHEPSPPYQRKLMASGELRVLPAPELGSAALQGSLFISGDTEGLHALAQGPDGHFNLRPWQAPLGQSASAKVPLGTLQLAWQRGLLVGLWQESPNPSPGVCAWSQARIELEPAPRPRGGTQPEPAALVAQAFVAAQPLAQGLSVSEPQAQASLASLQALVAPMLAAEVSNLALARLYLDMADAAMLLRKRPEAQALLEASTRLHRLLAADHPEAMAQALSRQAVLLRGPQRWAQAEALYQEALAALAARGLQQGETAGAVYNSLGTLYLRMARHDQAVAAFRQALAAQQHWGAPGLDVAGTLNNLAQVLARQGHIQVALNLMDEALSRLGNPGEPEQQLADLIRDNARALRGQAPPAVPMGVFGAGASAHSAQRG